MDSTNLGITASHVKTIASILHNSPIIREDYPTFAKALEISNTRIKKLKNDLQHEKITWFDVTSEVIGLWVGRSGSNATLDKLVRVIEVECGALDVGELLRLEFHLPSRQFENDPTSTSWNNLSPCFQQRVLQNLDALATNLSIEEILPTLEGKVLKNLMTGKGVQLFKQTVPEDLSYYVNRMILPRHRISLEIFKHVSSDILVFTGIDRYDLDALARNHDVRGSSEQMERITVQYIVLDDPLHFERICERTDRPVHWLRYENRKLFWMRSKGDLRTVQECVGKQKEEQTEEEFLQNLRSDQAVCISDTPGMGKTVLLARIGNHLRKADSQKTVIFLALSEFIRQFKQLSGGKSMIPAIVQALQDMTCQNELGREVLNSKLMSNLDKIRIELMLDGLDEVNSHDLNLAYEILEVIKSSFRSTRVWVATRPHLLHYLENKLSVMGYNIEPLDEDHQLQFLTLYWSTDMRCDPQRLKQFGMQCLNILKSTIRTKDHEIAGVPLQCLLIGEVYEEEATSYAVADQHSPVPTLLINSVTDLYKCLVAKKFQKYLTVHATNAFGGTQALLDMHVWLSLQLLFPEELKTFQDLFEPVDVDEILKVGILEAMSPTSPPTFIHRTFAEYFIAYLMIDRMGSQDWNTELSTFLSESVLETHPVKIDLYYAKFQANSTEFTHRVITYFLDAFMEDLRMEVIPYHTSKLLQKSFDCEDKMRRVAYASVTSDLFQILKFHDGLNAFDTHVTTIFTPELIHIAIMKSSSSIVKLATTKFEEIHQDINLDHQARTLQCAVLRGDFSIFEFLIKEKQLRELITRDLGSGTKHLLHDCVHGSLDFSKEEIDSKIQIMRMLAQLNPKLLEIKDEQGKTPIVCHQLHVRFVTELVKLGADVLAQNRINETVLHFCSLFLSSSDYHTILMSIPEEKLKMLVRTREVRGRTLLTSLIENMDPLEASLEKIKGLDDNFNDVDDDQQSVLDIAIKSGRNVSTLRKLIECGADVSRRGEEKGESYLHSAAEFGNVEAVAFLLEEYEMDVNIVDNEGLTPLDYAIRNYRGISIQLHNRQWPTLPFQDDKTVTCFETGLLLSQKGGRFKDFAGGSSWLHFTAEEGDLQSVRLLFLLGMDVNLRDEHGNTPLHFAVKYRRNKNKSVIFTVIKFLLEHGADPNISNKGRETPLHISLKNHWIGFETFELLKSVTNMEWSSTYSSLALHILVRAGKALEGEEFRVLYAELRNAGADINTKDMDGNSLLHAAMVGKQEGNIYHLVNSGALINAVNNQKETSLHLAAMPFADLGIIMYLIDHGADVYPKDETDRTFLHHFISTASWSKPAFVNFHSLVEYLIGKGHWDLFETTSGKLESTALQFAVEMLDVEVKTMSLLHTSNVNFNAVDKNGNSVLAHAIRGKRSVEFVSVLIEKFEANKHALNNIKNNLLHTASYAGTPEVLEYMLGTGWFEINGRNKFGNTALHLALSIGTGDFKKTVIKKCKLLVGRGADVNILSNEGLSPLAIVKERDDWEDKDDFFQLLQN